jgi:hypothetical protein
MRERHPEPAPLRTNDVRTVAVGTALWLVLLLGLAIFHDAVRRNGLLWWYPMCLCGIALGGIGLWSTSRQAARRRAAPDEQQRLALGEDMPMPPAQMISLSKSDPRTEHDSQ